MLSTDCGFKWRRLLHCSFPKGNVQRERWDRIFRWRDFLFVAPTAICLQTRDGGDQRGTRSAKCEWEKWQLHSQGAFYHTDLSQTQVEAQWPIDYGVGLRIKRSSVRIRQWPLRWVLGQGSLLPLSQGEAFTLASISYLAILVKYMLAKKKKKKKLK